ncbi:ABC transporter ATP-binding protein [Ruegeria hyattellae]|uniref:ABC transporter ATP-binding protein n=1 Tax=Ruegeria hyattellae TaxID=3233337 RepID=UPI00355BD1AB
MAGVRLENVSKHFGKLEVLHDINLSIEDGEFVVFVGPSGSGKSTLLRAIAGLENISSGRLLIDDVDVSNVDPSQRGVAMVFQSYALYPHMSVQDNMGFSLLISRAPKAERDDRTKAAAQILKIDHLLARTPGKLSGGQRQRVAIGRAIVREPKVFLLDEPLSNLDAALRVGMRAELAKLHRRLGATMIYVTHDQTEAMTLADKIVVIDKGAIQQIGAPIELYSNPVNLFVAQFLGSPCMNILNVTLIKKTNSTLVVTAPNVGEFTIAANGVGIGYGTALKLGFRPASVSISENSEGACAIVQVVERLGDQTICVCTLACGSDVTATMSGDWPIKPGADVCLAINQDRLHLFHAESCETIN